jgi:transposase
MTLYGGIDLHCNNSMVSVIDQENHLVSEKRLPNELPVIQAFLAPYRSELQ